MVGNLCGLATVEVFSYQVERSVLEMKMAEPFEEYTIIMYRDLDTRMVIAECPALQGCLVSGTTYGEALYNLTLLLELQQPPQRLRFDA